MQSFTNLIRKLCPRNAHSNSIPRIPVVESDYVGILVVSSETLSDETRLMAAVTQLLHEPLAQSVRANPNALSVVNGIFKVNSNNHTVSATLIGGTSAILREAARQGAVAELNQTPSMRVGR